MKVILDTNVLISGTGWKGGSPAKVIELWTDDKFVVFVTASILIEYENSLKKLSRHFSEAEVAFVLSFVRAKAKWGDPMKLPFPICDDPSDDIFIAAALGAHADAIVTGDKALLRAHVPEIKILKPVEFLKLF